MHPSCPFALPPLVLSNTLMSSRASGDKLHLGVFVPAAPNVGNTRAHHGRFQMEAFRRAHGTQRVMPRSRPVELLRVEYAACRSLACPALLCCVHAHPHTQPTSIHKFEHPHDDCSAALCGVFFLCLPSLRLSCSCPPTFPHANPSILAYRSTALAALSVLCLPSLDLLCTHTHTHAHPHV